MMEGTSGSFPAHGPAFMVSESAFIDALRETPDDLALRLVYADWLDDAGDSRGELVRLQCELDRTPLGQPRRNVLCQAIRDLCRDCQSDWLAPLKRRVLGWQKARFQFGLVENVVMSPTAFLKHAEAGLFEEMPYLVGVCLEGSEKPMDKALASPYIAQLQSLTLNVIGYPNTGRVVDHLSSLPTVQYLTSLNLANGRYGDGTAARLLQSQMFLNLRRLNLQNNALTAKIAKPLAESPLLPQLELLALGSRWDYGPNHLDDRGIRALIEAAPPLKLRWLDLSKNELSDSSAWDLAKSDKLPNIECLYLGGNAFGKASQTALEARHPGRVFYARCEPECLCL
jgi:uncharacterized protein (TIGR02996 family)